MRKFAIGKMSAVEIQQMASAAVKSGANTEEMVQLQKLGGFGQVPGNCHRDLQRKYFKSMDAPEPWKFSCLQQMKEEGQQVLKNAEISMLLPHQWVLALQAGDMLEDLTCTPEDLYCFWRAQERNPQMSKKMLKSLDWKNPSLLPVPWCLHGDSAPFTEADSLIVVSMRCLLTKRAIGESQLLVYALPKAASTKEAIQSLNETLAWSFSCLAQGVAPKKDKDGKPMEKQKGKRFKRGLLYAITGDLEYFAWEFGFPYPASNYLCPYCLADQFLEETARPFTDFRQDAAWRTSILNERELEEKYGSHPLLRMTEVKVSTIKLDVLHMLDLGVASYMHGSILVEIMNQLGGRSRAWSCFVFLDISTFKFGTG